MKTLDELIAEDEPARLAAARREIEIENLPENVAKREAKRNEEFDRGVRLGWWDADGNPLAAADEELDPEEGDSEEEE